jgi:hypothetical protein
MVTKVLSEALLQLVSREEVAGSPGSTYSHGTRMRTRAARRSDQQARPSRLGWARRFLPSWSCEFDSRHPLHGDSPRPRLPSSTPIRTRSALYCGRSAAYGPPRDGFVLSPDPIGLAGPMAAYRIGTTSCREFHRVCPLARRARISPITVAASSTDIPAAFSAPNVAG